MAASRAHTPNDATLPRRLAGAAILAAVVAILALLLSFWARRLDAEASLALAASELAGGSIEQAAERFASVAASGLAVDNARQGRALAEWLRSGAWSSAVAPRPETVPGLSLPAVLRRAVILGHSRELHDLVAGLTAEGRASAVPALRLAASETGGGDPSPVVRDRHGHRLGRVTSQGLEASVGAAELGWDDWLSDVVVGREARSGLRLTLDLELSRALQEDLESEWGTVVVLDAASGDVLAAVSDPRTLAREGGAAFLEQRREPASIAKLITASAALRAGIDLDAEIRAHPCRGSVQVEDGRLYCPVVAGELDGFEQALASSCNTTFARLGLELGSERMLEEYRRFGFQPPDRRDGYLGRWREPITDRRRLSELAIGLNRSEITPLHAAAMVAVFAEGRWTEPRFLLAADGRLGLSPRELPASTPGEALLGPDELALLRRGMASVTAWGTAARVGPPGVTLGMKTGTAAEPGLGFHVNYVGLLPLEEPRFAFAIRVTDERTSRRVRRAAYGVTRRVLTTLTEHLEPPAVDRWQQRYVRGEELRLPERRRPASGPRPGGSGGVEATGAGS